MILVHPVIVEHVEFAGVDGFIRDGGAVFGSNGRQDLGGGGEDLCKGFDV